VAGDGLIDARSSGPAPLPSRAIDREALAAALAEALPPGPWEVGEASGGSSGRVLLGHSGTASVFLKVGADGAALRRLGEIDVAPPVLASGRLDGLPFVAQPLLTAVSPPPSWFVAQPAALTVLVLRYQTDGPLRALTRPLHATALVDELRARAGLGDVRDPSLPPILAELGARAVRLPPARLVPTHGDPNRTNVLVGEHAVWLVDWDGLRASDPMRDLGQIAWWYVPPDGWAAYLGHFGERVDASGLLRLRWWVAAESVEVALSLREVGATDAAQGFLADAVAALEGRDNPRAWFLGEES
jgi:hypothetical protein